MRHTEVERQRQTHDIIQREADREREGPTDDRRYQKLKTEKFVGKLECW